MRLFAPDLYRNFAIGFAVGALLIAGGTADQWAGHLESPARAAQMAHGSDLSAEEFLAAGPQGAAQ